MESPSLVVSDPPHGEVDHHEAAELLGLAAAEARMKANFSAPEVWLSFERPAEAREAVETLRSTGLSVRAVPGSALAELPWPAPVASVRFDDDALSTRVGDADLEIPYSLDVLGVYCRPPADFFAAEVRGRAATGSARTSLGQRSTTAFVERMVGRGHDEERLQVAEALERATNLDLYARIDGTLRRVAVVQGLTDFSGLGDARKQRSSDNMNALVEECARRFEGFRLDRRLVDVRPRQRLSVGGAAPEPREGRKLYSFGTVGLRRLLEAIAPELADITQFELGSRLAYVLATEGDRA